MRRDAWWVQPAVVFTILSAFVIYATWAAFQGEHYTFGPYLSPFYSPELFGSSPHNWFGPRPGWWPSWLVFSPALLILPFPGLFRVTCYYYRGAYYKAFWADPPSCTVGEPRSAYRGEHSFPLIVQNIHRYFLYIALLFLVILAYDAWKAMWFTDPVTGGERFGIGVGTLVMLANVTLLTGYTLGCHSLRHIVGGYRDRLAGSPVRKRAYDCASCLNRGHMSWAWFSLFAVALADLYVRLCSMGMITDWRIL
ncbi:MAG: succinate dehydrogenase [Gemmatimonadaceae bacterium]